MSTETKRVGFTRGPWEALPNGNAVRSRFVPGDPQQAGELVADLYARGYGVPTAEREANAALISAAPDLYAALEAGIELVGWWETEDGTMPPSAVAWRDKARAALAKARGNITAP